MPLVLRETRYPLPGEGHEQSITGRELIAIEDAFGVDALTLLSSLSPDIPERPGYTRSKALFALAWVAVHRVNKDMTLDAMLDTVSVDELEIEADENPTEAA